MTQSYTTLGFILLILLLFIGGYVVFLQSIKTMNQEASRMMQIIGDEEKKKQRLEMLQSVLESSMEGRERLTAALLTQDRIVPLVQELESSGKKYNVLLEFQDIEEVAGEGGSITLSFDINGEFEDGMQFLESVEKLPYLFTMSQVHVTKREEGVVSVRKIGPDGKQVVEELPPWRFAVTMKFAQSNIIEE
jgi:Tfp pilus assembly protein PilO